MAAASGSSPGSNSPLGIDQAPRSFFAQNGPPGCTRNTSSFRSRNLCIKRPALVFAMLVLSIAAGRSWAVRNSETASCPYSSQFLIQLDADPFDLIHVENQ